MDQKLRCFEIHSNYCSPSYFQYFYHLVSKSIYNPLLTFNPMRQIVIAKKQNNLIELKKNVKNRMALLLAALSIQNKRRTIRIDLLAVYCVFRPNGNDYLS